MGSIYKRGDVYWIKYYRNGKSYRESTKSDKKMVAKKLLDRREGEIAQGKIPAVQFEKVTFDELAEELERDYAVNQKRSIKRLRKSIEHLGRFFAGSKIPSITTPAIKSYIQERQTEGASNATINRESSALKRMMNLGAKQTPPVVDRVPYIPMLKENNIRKGFFEYNEFVMLRNALPAYLNGFVTFGYKTGWRLMEIAGLTWSQVDRKQGVVRLEAGETKNQEGRTIYLDKELQEVIDQQWELHRRNGGAIPYVFLNREGSGPIRSIRKAWSTALKKAGLEPKLFHDLRRTAVRNMVRSGVAERVAMTISGHKTRSVFDRYNIVNLTDLRDAARRQSDYLDNQLGTVLGTIEKKSGK